MNLIRLFFASLCLTAALHAQVPQIINYQSRVAVGNVNFTGTGQFKFALINTGGTQTFWSNDGTSAAGAQPVAAVQRPVASGLFDVLLGDTGLTNMTAIPHAVFNNPEVWLRVWFNDGVQGFEAFIPDVRIGAVGYAMVADGVRAGGVTSGMIAPGAVTSTHIANGTITAANIAPGVLGGGSGTAPAGSLTLSGDPNSASLAAAGYTRISQMNLAQEVWQDRGTGETVAALGINLNASVVWTGTELLVWAYGNNFVLRYRPDADQWTKGSSLGAPTAYSDYGRDVRAVWTGTELIVITLTQVARYNPTTDTWTAGSTVSAPFNDRNQAAVWTGSEMLVCGFFTSGRYNPATDTWSTISPTNQPLFRDSAWVWTGSQFILWGTGLSQAGARYSPATDTWTPMTTTGAPSARKSSTCVWSGTEMILFGGESNGGAPFSGGGRYNPSTDVWSPLSAVNMPSPRDRAASVWTGSEMIVWGGDSSDFIAGTIYRDDGARYNPATDTWTPIPAQAGVVARRTHEAAWTGTEMIVVGGNAGNIYSRYTPSTGLWKRDRLSVLESSARSAASAVWTGSEMLVWGGVGSAGALGTGVRYHPQLGRRLPLPVSGAPSARVGHAGVWSGAEMIVWGGVNGSTYHADGARYQPVANVWVPITSTNAPAARDNFSVVWTGTEYIVWGGFNGSGHLNDGARYSPASDTWTAISSSGAPSARRLHRAVWTGSEMLVWGGLNAAFTPQGDGARYSPATDTWTPISATAAPSARFVHTATWTGSEMIVWGGNTPSATNTGARYRPATNDWIPLPGDNAPAARSGHTAVWTGTEYILWGGASGGSYLNGGARFNPLVGQWESITTTTGAPTGRTGHTAVWAQGQMLIHGGDDNSAAAPFSDIFGYVPPQTVFVYQHP